MLFSPWLKSLCEFRPSRRNQSPRRHLRYSSCAAIERLEQRVLLAATTTTAVSLSLGAPVYGQTETFTATVSSTSTPTGGPSAFTTGPRCSGQNR